MNKLFERLTIVSIFLILVNGNINTLIHNQYTSVIIPLQAVAESVVLLALFLLTIYKFIPLLWQKQIGLASTRVLGSLIISYLILAPFELLFETVAVPGTVFQWKNVIHPAIISRIIPELAIILLAGGLIGGIRQLILTKKFALLKKISLVSGSAVAVGMAIFACNYFMDLGYQGTNEIKFVEAEFSSLDELLAQPQFEDKVVYIDLWFSNCKPCIKEMPHMAELKKKLAGQEIEYLYIARETSNPDSRQRWINAIQKYDLKGWHAYMVSDMQDKIWEPILENQPQKKSPAYPRYLIVDRSGKVVNYDASNPSYKEVALSEVKAILNQ